MITETEDDKYIACRPHTFDLLYEALQDPELLVEYLEDAIAEDDPAVLKQSLDTVAKVKGGYSKLAEATGLNRQSLYRALSQNGDPKLSTLTKVLAALGVGISFKPLPAKP